MTIQNGYGPLRRVYVRPPRVDDVEAWEAYGWRARPDPERMLTQHEAFRRALVESGAELVVGERPVAGDIDAQFAYDPTIVTDDGVILLRSGKEGRRREPEVVEADLNDAGIATFGRLDGDALADGGDMFFLDERTLLVGISYRTNPQAVKQLTALLEPRGIDVVAFDLPHFHGPGECLHLMSSISPLDADLALVYLPLTPVRLLSLLEERAIAIVQVAEEDFDTLGPNVLAVAPRSVLAIEGNDRTNERLREAGVEVRTFEADQLCTIGDGGPTCLTRPLDRA
jgi:N-dimethylarginine dimethylaminohydrolase